MEFGLLLSGIIFGAIFSYFVLNRFSLYKNKINTKNQSIVLLDKIKKVSKLITVEGEFAEIYHHENTKEMMLGLLTSKKKAIVLVNAKIHIGFDFRKIEIKANNNNKTIILSKFPQPEVLSIEPNFKFYDIKNGFLNKFTSENLTKINQQAKEYVLQKIPESNLMQTANKEAIDAILLMQSIVETIGWKLDYSALELSVNNKAIQQKKISINNEKKIT